MENHSLYDEQALRNHLIWMHDACKIPDDHVNYLKTLKDNFQPKVIYDIGSAVLHWTREVNIIWPDAKVILFDCFEPFEFLYKDYDYHLGLLTDEDKKVVKFYQSNEHPSGNSYYKENDDIVFPKTSGIIKVGMTLDTIVKTKNFPLPDLVKMDVQGCEKDVFLGAQETLKNTKYLILEAQHKEYNRGAPNSKELIPFVETFGWKCIASKFSINGDFDADYCFVNTKI